MPRPAVPAAVTVLVLAVSGCTPGSSRADAPRDRPSTALGGPTTTGVPAGTTLEPSGSIVVDTPGQVVRGLEVRGVVTIEASDVTVEDTRVIADGYFAITVADDVDGVVIRDSEIDGRGRSGSAGSAGIVGGSPLLERLDIHGVENGVVPGSGTVLRQSWVHDLVAPGDPHYDGVQMDGGQTDVVVERSTIDLSDRGQTAAVMINNLSGPISRVRVRDNVLLGGGYTVYADGQFSSSPIEDVEITGNRLLRGTYGYAAITRARPTWVDNTDLRTGRPAEP
ncbi:hypothetical protein ASG49_08245 [Marmoricola sp. Leaf446]|uniref:hypothetical protein n=1 Tax=Marmoricola sp. Leaf446 TaxID=1736379 RepID=UPI0006F62AAA|nr:hypothetical protein [Marmoricola sp. Leaf446]KQT91973.1 hypothetical protein ASG49_08245 [Marmoricola sp. Leaf446]